MTFAWRPGSQYDVTAPRGADSVLASDCRAQFGHPSTRRGCRICVTVRLPVRPCGETTYWQANANTPLSVTPLLNVPIIAYGGGGSKTVRRVLINVCFPKDEGQETGRKVKDYCDSKIPGIR